MSFSSLYVGATGVVAHNASMQVVGNNLANVSTTGYKKADTQFGSLMSQQLGTGGSIYETGAFAFSQIGKGVAVSEIRTIFTEGGLETTTTATDLAIEGNGYFGVNNPYDGNTTNGAEYYTRAGAFRFNNEAYLVDPHGYRLQGYVVDRETGELATTISDVQLPYEDEIVDGNLVRTVQSEPRATTSFEMVTNLDHTAADLFGSYSTPFMAMLEAYNANLSNASTPFGDTLPEYSSSITCYDNEGNGHEVTVYFDPIADYTLSNATPGNSYWEYLIAIPAESDGSAAYGTSGAGLVGAGVMVFDGQGQFVNQVAFSLDSTTASSATSPGAWTTASFDEDGLPQFAVTFGSNGGAIGTEHFISYDFGITSATGTWTGGVSNASGLGNNVQNLASIGDPVRDARVTTSYDNPSATLYHIQDGYTSGYLQYVSVDREGFLNGHFTNNQTEQLFQVAVYTFNSQWGLRRSGHTNFVATEASGAAIAGTASTNGRGTIAQNTLEESNVDMAEEFAKMIITQRGYQANTKVITTSDSLLNTLISTKR
ncbi:flagellar hook protein FlgE [Pseudodesulfovibrio portus]|uniref:Flagellar hook protein FlgE n=1 Tax=Pseudodesulfovibrio portus TaxID=231439 RepID=A0ABM8ARD2_9BACT|nr:flagellar hook-basal body complex protein [Pseudodesulfovibrio portus]BDQ33993.1 flagellar hook protein FlgE [Pseudodesulfovibrio portus]